MTTKIDGEYFYTHPHFHKKYRKLNKYQIEINVCEKRLIHVQQF